MERWVGKVAVVTGASSGIGAAIAIDLTKFGVIVIGLAPIIEEFDNIQKILVGAKGEFHAHSCDVTDETSVKSAFDWIEKRFNRINILVNNAGVYLNTTILGADSKMEDLSFMIDINVVILLHCTRAAYRILKKTGEFGHIVNIGSCVSHVVPFLPPPLTNSVYPGTKHFVKAITEVLRQELIYLGKQVRISMISPGLVKTGIFIAGGFDIEKSSQMSFILPEDVSAACMFILGTPQHVQVHDLIIAP